MVQCMRDRLNFIVDLVIGKQTLLLSLLLLGLIGVE